MSILEGVKAVNIKHEKPRFVIKSKPTPKEHREDGDFDTVIVNDADTLQFI